VHEHFPASYEALAAMAKGTKYERISTDKAERDRLLFEAMRASDDPITREIGSGLADGSMTWRDVATNSAYAESVSQKLAILQDFDFSAIVTEMEQEKAIAGRERDRANNDDQDEVWQGFGKERR
jgi:hypothetical protein